MIKVIKVPEESGLIIKGARKTVQNKAKGQKRWMPWYVIGYINASLLGNTLVDKKPKLLVEDEEYWEMVKEQLEQEISFKSTLSFE